MMRICSPQLGIAPDATLGGEVYDRETLIELAKLGVECELLLPKAAAAPDVAGWRLTRLPLRRGYRWFVSNPLFMPFIGQVYRERPFHLLRVHSPRFIGFAAHWAKKLYKLPVPIVMHHHHLDFDRWTQHVDRRAMQRADLIITGSRFARNQLLQAFALSPDKVVVTPYGVSDSYQPVSTSEKQRLRTEYGFGASPLLLHVGSLIPRKNLPLLFHVLYQVSHLFPTTKLLLVGRGPEQDTLQQLAHQLRLTDRIHFAGHLSETAKHHYYQMADLLVTTSLMEGFGLAVAEAMACGAPAVAGRVGSLPELINDQETGMLVSVNNQDAFTAAICTLLQDETRIQAMRQAGIERINQQFRWPITAKETLKFYQQVL
ncbi:MAG: glycosyltransferase family 4 protein [Anaerolineales bacterium]|nr:glycosyltransferase family 4 protein [Anaerolineales bacterium]